MHWYTDVLKKYTVFAGRATRSEYWMFTLYNFIIGFIVGFVEGLMGLPPVISTLYMLAVLLPSLAVAVRRLHDTGRSGWWMLIVLIPFLGALVLIYFMVQDSTPGTNKFGINPKEIVPGDAPMTSVHQSEPEIKTTEQTASDVVINDVQASEPIPSVTEADSASSSDTSSSSTS